MADYEKEYQAVEAPKTESKGFLGEAKQALAEAVTPTIFTTRGLAESIPFYGEKLASGMPEPQTTYEKGLTRLGRNLPYNLPLIISNPPLGLTSLAGSTVAGQAAEEAGGGPWTQMGAEMLGGGLPFAARSIAGRMYGYAEPYLKDLTKRASSAGFEMGPGASTRRGMTYGAGETEEALIRNLDRATEEATKRTGFPTKEINESWFNETRKKLGDEVGQLFKGKTFVSDVADNMAVNNVLTNADKAFGEQSSLIKNIITDNIMGQRPGGAIVSQLPTGSQFSAEGLRKAIIEVNQKLGSGTNANQNQLYYQLKDALENIAAKNLRAESPELADRYLSWRNKYNAFATLEDVNARFGQSGIAKGKLNPQTLLDVIVQRNGTSNAVNNPLFYNLGEFGEILQTAKTGRAGFLPAVTASIKESGPVQSVVKVIKPTASSDRYLGIKQALGLAGGPFSASTQSGGGSKDPYEYAEERLQNATGKR